jgi:uncharacterized membrane protein
VSSALFMAAILQSLSQGLQGWIFMALSSLSLFKTQLVAVIAAAIVYLAFALLLGRSWGAVGVVLAQSIGLLMVVFPIGLLAVRRRMRLGVAHE